MYSGIHFSRTTGRIIGAHQKFDRTARNHLERLLSNTDAFPRARKIVQFEGKKGPDALKYKSPAKDEPWHYIDPFDKTDTQLQDQIEEHMSRLARELKAGNQERSAFEAAWLAHAIVDGLTPAHHVAYEEKLTEIRGEGKETRNSVREKLVMPGDNRREKIKNNWLMWAPRGLLMGHAMFEFGVATILAPISLRKGLPTARDIERLEEIGFRALFEQTAREIAELNLYSKYLHHGWTPKLVRQVRSRLGPNIVRCVTLAWYSAAKDGGLS